MQGLRRGGTRRNDRAPPGFGRVGGGVQHRHRLLGLAGQARCCGSRDHHQGTRRARGRRIDSCRRLACLGSTPPGALDPDAAVVHGGSSEPYGVGEASFEVPSDLPLGYHILRARSNGDESSMPLIIAPAWLGFPERMGDRRAWGLAAQLYSVRAAQSWGVGDFTDLEDLAVWSAAEHGSDYVLVNPMHAAEPVPPMEPSPYLPTSRRFANPIYLRVERVPEYALASNDQRRKIDKRRKKLMVGFDPAAPIDRDRSWKAKRKALSILFSVPRAAGRQASFDAYRRREGVGLQNFATWAVLAAHHGARFSEWPEELRHPDSPAVAQFRHHHAREIEFECWLQWLIDEQLASVQSARRRVRKEDGGVRYLDVGYDKAKENAYRVEHI